MQTAGKWLWVELGGGFGTEIKLYVINIGMEPETMVADDLAKWGIKMKKWKGPSTVPWGSPWLNGAEMELEPPLVTNCVLLKR